MLREDELLVVVVFFFFFFDAVEEPLPDVARQKAFTFEPLERV